MELVVSGSTKSKFGFVVFTVEGITMFTKEDYQKGCKLSVEGEVEDGLKGLLIKKPIIEVVGQGEVKAPLRVLTNETVAFKKVSKSLKGWVATDIYDRTFFSKVGVEIGIYKISFSEGREMCFIDSVEVISQSL